MILVSEWDWRSSFLLPSIKIFTIENPKANTLDAFLAAIAKAAGANSANGNSVNCNTVPSLPTLSFTFKTGSGASGIFSVSPQQYVRKVKKFTNVHRFIC
jgi:hypothetical protein